jgi:hypothetical protein
MRLASLGVGAALALAIAGCSNGNGACGSCRSEAMCCETAPGVSTCIEVLASTQHCGACGNACAPGQRCSLGVCTGMTVDAGPPRPDSGPSMCMPTCGSTQRCCVRSCVERNVAIGSDGRSDSSFSNCNGCGIACDMTRSSACSIPGGGMTGAPRCMCGVYDACGAGQTCVRDAMTSEFVCVNTMTDPNNCGMVGRRCAMGESCMAGMCVCGSTGGACATGESCCAGACVDTSGDDPANCGGCGTTCAGGTSCQSGMCVCGTGPTARACAPATMTALGELCCAGGCVAQDGMNCGSCGATCDTAAGEDCINGIMLPFGMAICCGEPPPFPGFPGICSGDPFPGLDAGFPFPGIDSGAPATDAGPPDSGTDTDAGFDAGTTP